MDCLRAIPQRPATGRYSPLVPVSQCSEVHPWHVNSPALLDSVGGHGAEKAPWQRQGVAPGQEARDVRPIQGRCVVGLHPRDTVKPTQSWNER